MLERARVYREKAVAEHRAADASTLPNVRDRHLRAAELWEQKAQVEERNHRAREANEVARRALAESRRHQQELRARRFGHNLKTQNMAHH